MTPSLTRPSLQDSITRWGEWPSGSRRCIRIGRIPVQNLTRRSARLRDPTSLRGSQWPSGQKCKMQWLTLSQWGCPLDNGPKLAVGQPNSSFFKKWLPSNSEGQIKCVSSHNQPFQPWPTLVDKNLNILMQAYSFNKNKITKFYFDFLYLQFKDLK